jgi:thiamine-phosphate pyrophosphorylase
MIKKISENISLPIVAVGGIDKSNVKSVIESGADGIVSVSAVLNSNDVNREIKDFLKIINEVKSL